MEQGSWHTGTPQAQQTPQTTAETPTPTSDIRHQTSDNRQQTTDNRLTYNTYIIDVLPKAAHKVSVASALAVVVLVVFENVQPQPRHELFAKMLVVERALVGHTPMN